MFEKTIRENFEFNIPPSGVDYLGAPLEIRGTLPRDLSGVGVKAKVELTLP